MSTTNESLIRNTMSNFLDRSFEVCASKMPWRWRPAKRDFLQADCLDVVESFLAFLRQTAVFATISRALNDLVPQVLRDEHELTALGRWLVERADAGANAVRQGPPVPRPHAAPLRSDVFLDPVCPTAHGAASRQLSAVGIWLNRRAIRSRSGRVSAYGVSTFATHVKISRLPCSRRSLAPRFINYERD